MTQLDNAKPKIYIFDNTPGDHDWHSCLAMAEDGHCLAAHVCSHPCFMPHDMGVTSDWKHEKYDAHYPGGYELEIVNDPRSHTGLQAAFALNRELARKAKEEKEKANA